ncbi:MAG: hypothetical protein H7Z40_22580 [Phycisphaerae bacterium]|nr:hypothetical protein [Gemmatimonadaceae bacterium]
MIPKSDGVIAPDTATRTLAIAAGAVAYREDETPVAPGSITGSVRMNGALPADTMVTPDRDSTGCRPFQDVTLPKARGARTIAGDTAEVAIANAVAWLVGVTHGPPTSFPRRVNMVLDGCHFEPRVLLAPTGATIITSNRDEMITDLRFVDHGVAGAAPREQIGFTDPGQLVPSSKALAKAGLVEVHDEKHAWVRGFVAVAPHPFVAVTEPDGNFVFEGVPAGAYQLVVWHERLGARVMPVRVEQGVATIVKVTFGGP